MKQARLALTLAFAFSLMTAVIGRAQPAGAKADLATVQAILNTQSLQAGQQAVIAIVLEVRKGYHAQSHEPFQENLIKCEVTLAPNPAITVYAPVYPPGEVRNYPALGKLSVYEGRSIIYVPIQVKTDAAVGPIKLTGEIELQICDDKTCFLPKTEPFVIETTIALPGRALAENQPELFKGFDPTSFARVAATTIKRERIVIFGREIDDQSFLFIFAAAFVIGIMFNGVPCVLPVLPLKAIGFYKVAEENRARSIAFGAIFSAGLISTFAVLGLFVVVLHRFGWGELFANAWFLGFIVIVLTVFAISMFGVFTVNVPTALYNVTPRHDTYTGNFLFGILTAILSTPCTFGLSLNLLIVASYQKPIVGLSLVMMVGAGMAFPYFVLSAFPELARKMPRTGPWAELLKQMMGFLLLLSAIYFARRFIEVWINTEAFWWSLFAVVLAAGAFLVFRSFQLSKQLTGRLVAIVLALIMILPAGVFAYRITNPPIAWQPFSVASLDEARSKNQIVMIEFTAAWCSNCVTLEVTVFHDEQAVRSIRENSVKPLRADLTSQTAPGWKLLRDVSAVPAIPLTLIYSPKLPEPIKLTGVYSTSDLIEAMNRAAGK